MTHCKTSPTVRKPLSANQLRAMGSAIDRWLRDKRNSPRTWDRLLAVARAFTRGKYPATGHSM